MNPREFCWGEPYEVFIGTTYNFDPVFFERLVLRDVQSSCKGAIIIAADHHYLVKNVGKWQTQVSKLGREYVLAPARMNCLFHPKMMVKLSRDKASIWIGSNNMTYAGWYSNSELACTLSLALKGFSESGLISLLQTLKGYVAHDRVIDAIENVFPDFSSRHNEPQALPIIMTPPEQSLASVLLRRWQGRQFKKLRIFTGSTDEEGAFIEWCAKEFGIEEVIIAANPENISLTLSNVRKLSAAVSIAAIDTREEFLHAKGYFFEDKGDCAVITGSANCSRAAWLIPPASGGNVECIAIYDEVDRKSFPIIAEYPKEAVSALKFLRSHRPAEITEKRFDANRVRVVAVRVSRLNASLEVEVEGRCEELTGVSVNYNGVAIKLGAKDESKTVWHTERVVDLSDSLSNFCEVILSPNNLSNGSVVWWVEDVEELNHSIAQRRLTEAFINLGSAQGPRELRRALNELYEIQDIIFEISDDATITQRRATHSSEIAGRRTDEPDEVEPVTPELLIKSLTESHKDNFVGHHWHSGGFLSLVSLSGILRSIFAAESSDDDFSHGEQQSGQQSPNSRKRTIEERVSEIKEEENEEWKSKLNEKISEVMDDFFERFLAKEFALKCSVYQFQQATAYPLALIVVGTRGRWIDDQNAFQWIVKLVDILFNREYDETNGLLHCVQNRYGHAGKVETFRTIVGDGSLWILLLLAIASTKAEQLLSSIMKSVMLRTVFQEKALIEKAESRKLSALRGSAAFDKTVVWLSENGSTLVTLIGQVENLLKAEKDLFVAKQRQYFDEHDLVFHPHLGWGWYDGVDENSRVRVYFQLRAEMYLLRHHLTVNGLVCVS